MNTWISEKELENLILNKYPNFWSYHVDQIVMYKNWGNIYIGKILQRKINNSGLIRAEYKIINIPQNNDSDWNFCIEEDILSIDPIQIEIYQTKITNLQNDLKNYRNKIEQIQKEMMNLK